MSPLVTDRASGRGPPALRFLDVAAGSAALRRWPGELGLHRCEVAQADGMAAVAAWLDSQPGDQAWAAGLSERSFQRHFSGIPGLPGTIR